MRLLILLLLAAVGWGQEQVLAEHSPVLLPGRWALAEITAYCGGPCSVCGTTGQTADGTLTRRRPYGLAVDNSLGLGGQAYIPVGFGYLDRSLPLSRWFKFDDRGGALDSERRDKEAHPYLRIDLRFVDHGSAKLFGRKVFFVYIADR